MTTDANRDSEQKQPVETRPLSRYEEIVRDNVSIFAGKRFIYKYSNNLNNKLLVMIGTHNCKGAFPSLTTLFDDDTIDFDLLFVAEEVNTYYQSDDDGASYFELIKSKASKYAARNVVFFGSSMAGYCALKWALTLGANAVVSNPQIDLAATSPLAWPELKQTIARAGGAEPITAIAKRHAEVSSSLVTLWSNHPMDVVNFKLFLEILASNNNLSVSIDKNEDTNHKYLVKNYRHFLALVNRAVEFGRYGIASHKF